MSGTNDMYTWGMYSALCCIFSSISYMIYFYLTTTPPGNTYSSSSLSDSS
jgi:hypothetical protein